MPLSPEQLLGLLIGLTPGLLVALVVFFRERARASAALSQQATETAAGSARLEAATQQVQALKSTVQTLEQQLDQTRSDLAQQRSETASMQAKHQAEQHAADEKLKLLESAREKLSVEFSELANRIFHDSSKRFAEQSGERLGQTLTPLKEQLAEFRKRVDHVYNTDTESRTRLLHEITSLKELNRQMSDEALNLTRALKGDNKVQGGWGEVILERVLEESGLTRGREYDTQVALKDEAGQRRLPDVIVRLPEARDVVIDSKVSLVEYERYCSASDEQERARALNAHVASLKTHIEQLSVKDYEGLAGLRSLDFVLVFVPIEAAFMRAMEADPTLFSRAYDRNVIVVSPTTLLATLRTVQTIWRYERQNRNAEEIARQAGGLHDQFARVLESLEELGKQLERSSQAYEQTLDRFSRGRGNLVNRVTRIEKLGAKTKKQLPSEMLSRSEEDPDEDELSDDPDALPPA